MDDKINIYTQIISTNTVIIIDKITEIETKIERPLYLRMAINPMIKLVTEKIPATERERKGRGKGSATEFNKRRSIINEKIESTMSIIENLPKRVVGTK